MNGKKDIELYDILKRSDYLFPDMATAVGLNNNGRYDLIRNQTLSDVINEIKNYKMQKKFDTETDDEKKTRKFTPNNLEQFLYKCCYFIYPEKRDIGSNYKIKNDITPDEFSRKIVNIFFELSGVYFSYLIIDSTIENKDFIKKQKEYLKELIDYTLKFFMLFKRQKTTYTNFASFLEGQFYKFRFLLFNEYIIETLRCNPLSQQEWHRFYQTVSKAFDQMKRMYYCLDKHEQVNEDTLNETIEEFINRPTRKQLFLNALEKNELIKKKLANIFFIYNKLSEFKNFENAKDYMINTLKITEKVIIVYFGVDESEKLKEISNWKDIFIDIFFREYCTHFYEAFISYTLITDKFNDSISFLDDLCDRMYDQYLISEKEIFKPITNEADKNKKRLKYYNMRSMTLFLNELSESYLFLHMKNIEKQA